VASVDTCRFARAARGDVLAAAHPNLVVVSPDVEVVSGRRLQAASMMRNWRSSISAAHARMSSRS